MHLLHQFSELFLVLFMRMKSYHHCAVLCMRLYYSGEIKSHERVPAFPSEELIPCPIPSKGLPSRVKAFEGLKGVVDLKNQKLREL